MNFDPNKEAVNYKANLLQIYKEMTDPFGNEFVGDKFGYEKNPADPTKPSKTVAISPFEPIWD